MMSVIDPDGPAKIAHCFPRQDGVHNGRPAQVPGPPRRGFRPARHKDAEDVDLTSLRLKVPCGAEHARMGISSSDNRHTTPCNDSSVSSARGRCKDIRPIKAWPGYITVPSDNFKVLALDYSLQDVCPAGVAPTKRSVTSRCDQLPPPAAKTTPHKMVYKGRPSAGCENCRKMKKNCDQKLPACSRCVRMGKACGGYRNLSDLMFKNETESVTRRASAASAQSDPGPNLSSLTPARQGAPDVQTSSVNFFFEHIVSDSHLAFLEGASPDDFLLKPIMACALAAMANRDDSDDGRALARLHYVDAITATNTALRHPQKVKEDNTLIAVWLLSLFERLIWEPSDPRGPSSVSWMQHLGGGTQVLHLRGQSQTRTERGARMFREMRDHIINQCVIRDIEAPEFLVQWTQGLAYDPANTPGDQLAILLSRFASIKTPFVERSKTDEELIELARVLERDLLDWEERTLATGSVCSFYAVHDPESKHAWNGTRHEYATQEAHRQWNIWRYLRIALSRVQEAMWRRSWPILPMDATASMSDLEHFSTIRARLANDICIAAAYDLGNSPDMPAPSKASVSSGVLLVLPLGMAGTCLLEQLSEPVVSPGGNRMILVDRPLYENLFDPASTQLAWIIERLEYITYKTGVRWGVHASRFLKGELKIHLDLGRSVAFRNDDFNAQIEAEILDWGSLMDLTYLMESE